MIDGRCPWCAGELRFEFDEQAAEQTCPDCRTTWSMEESVDDELTLAA